MADLRRNLDFKRWAARRPLPDSLQEANWLKTIFGRGKTDLTTAQVRREGGKAAGLVGKAVKVAANPIGAGMEFFTGLATAALSGNLGEAWEKIKDVCGVFSDVKDVARAAASIPKIQKHKANLAMHLREMKHQGLGLEDAAMEGILEAVFEVDLPLVAEVPPKVWPLAVGKFLSGLDGGYGGLGEKTFIAVLYQAILEEFQGLQALAGELDAKVQQLLQAFKSPAVAQVMQAVAQADPPLDPSRPGPVAQRVPGGVNIDDELDAHLRHQDRVAQGGPMYRDPDDPSRVAFLGRRHPEYEHGHPGQERSGFRQGDYAEGHWGTHLIRGLLVHLGGGVWEIRPPVDIRHNDREFWDQWPSGGVRVMPGGDHKWDKRNGEWRVQLDD